MSKVKMKDLKSIPELIKRIEELHKSNNQYEKTLDKIIKVLEFHADKIRKLEEKDKT